MNAVAPRAVSVAQLTANAPLLVLSPHPDDESLGCGGLIAACAESGIPLIVALLTDGAGSHRGSASHPPPVLARLRADETRAALAALGLPPDALRELGWPDRQAPVEGAAFDAAVAQVVGLARDIHAGCILASWVGDPHCDHAAAAAIAAAAARTGLRHLSYPVWGRITPGAALAGRVHQLDVRRWLDAKRRAIGCHRSQLGAVISDAAESFTLPSALIEACLGPTELYIEHG